MYYKINKKSVICDELLNFVIDETKDWWIEYFGFKTKVVPNEIIFKDKTLKSIFEMYPFTGGILKLDPYEIYDWHKDSRRGVTINMLLKGFESKCFFRDDISKEEFLLNYEPNTYFLFNTQKTHKVCNGSDVRYVFSIEFFETLETLNYENLYKKLRLLCY